MKVPCSNCGKDMGKFPISEFCSKTCHLESVKKKDVVDLKKVKVLNQIMGKRKAK